MNGKNLCMTFDEKDNPLDVTLSYAGYGTEEKDDCCGEVKPKMAKTKPGGNIPELGPAADEGNQAAICLGAAFAISIGTRLVASVSGAGMVISNTPSW